ncbi:MAG: hypothetical protein H0W74_06785 [Sphingosinicella sp.]|nr:hypothetical protein [Sphingosinicella sp.]
MASKLFAPHYAEAAPRICGPDPAPLYSQPATSADTMAELQPGESFGLLDITAGWAWGYRMSDHLVGYLRASDLAAAEGA